MSDISTKTIKAVITNTTPTFKASIVQKGADGKEIELQVNATHIQWRLADGTWANLVALADLKGADGTNGIDGTDGLDGNGIASITLTSGDHSPGTTDTYTITFDDATTTTFTVYNGANGLGTGDMLKSVYDTNSNNIVDNAEKVNNHTVETDVPSGALFTDTVYTHPNHSGDVTSDGDGAQTITSNAVSNAKLAQVATNTIKGRKTVDTGNVEDLSVSDTLTMLGVYTQTETNSLLALKAPLSSPEFTGTPTINDYNFKSLKNAIINGGFQVNQRAVAGSVVLSTGVYGHDRWKAGASGCSYTFATVENVTTLTISAGSLIQVIEGLNLETDTYCLSWEGTAQGKIGAGSYGNSGITGSVTGGTNLNIEFGTGTLSKVRLNKGFVPIEYQAMPYADVLRECQRYYVRFNAPNPYSRYGMGDSATANIANIIINFPNTMITTPTSIDYSGAFAIQTTGVTSAVSSVGLSIPASSKNIGFLDCNTSGLTAGRVALLISHDNTTSYIGFNAEL